jgi:predicted nucleic acid-binding protein
VLIGLSSIGQLHLLKKLLHDEIIIPEAVWHEVVETGAGRPGARAIESADWITVRQVSDTDLLCLLKNELDRGEAEAIALAKEIEAKLILLDERDARKTAKSLRLNVLGTIGLLIQAKQAGRITSLQAMLDQLRDEAQFRISNSLYELAMKAVGEIA